MLTGVLQHRYVECMHHWTLQIPTARELTLALQALPHQAPQQGAAVVAEGRDLVVVNTELVGHVNTEPLRTHLQGETHAQGVTAGALFASSKERSHTR